MSVSVLNCHARIFSAIGKGWLLSVVWMNLRFQTGLRPRPMYQTAYLVAANRDALCCQCADQSPSTVTLLAGGERGLQTDNNLA